MEPIQQTERRDRRKNKYKNMCLPAHSDTWNVWKFAHTVGEESTPGGEELPFPLSVFIFYTCRNQHIALLFPRIFLWQLVVDQNAPKHSVGINKPFLTISTHSACIFLHMRTALWFSIPENTPSPVLILSSVPCSFLFCFPFLSP